MITELAAENAGVAKIVKVNVDESPGTAARYQINSIPTLIIFKDGQAVKQFVGVQQAPTLIAALEAACAEVEGRLEATIAADPALARKREITVAYRLVDSNLGTCR